MTQKTIKSTRGQAQITLAYGGSVRTLPHEVHLKASENHTIWYFDGPTLRDALLEAFPLPVAKDDCCELAEWERDLLGVDVEENTDPEAVLAAASAYAEGKANAAFAAAFVGFVTGATAE